MEIPSDHIFAEVPIGNLDTHVLQVRERLKVLNQSAFQNALESGDRSRERQNKDAKLPSFTVGDKVLQHDTTAKKGQCRKLRIEYKGPFQITEVLRGKTYKLQHCVTGDEIQRPVFVNRLRK